LEVRARLIRWWLTFANAVGGFIEEAAFRVVLAFKVLAGRVPLRTEKLRTWSKVVEAPVLVDVYDWTSDRRIFSVLVWPPLEVEPPEAYSPHEERLEEVISAISRGAAYRLWCTRWEVDRGLMWDNKRRVWVAADGFAYAPSEVRTTKEAEGAA
jgi:hypothetical protein